MSSTKGDSIFRLTVTAPVRRVPLTSGLPETSTWKTLRRGISDLTGLIEVGIFNHQQILIHCIGITLIRKCTRILQSVSIGACTVMSPLHIKLPISSQLRQSQGVTF